MRGGIVLNKRETLAQTLLMIDSLKGNEYESYLTTRLWSVYYELKRQVDNETNIQDVTNSKKDWDDFWEGL